MTVAAGPRLLVAHEQRLLGECLSAVFTAEWAAGEVQVVTDPDDLPLALGMRRPDVLLVRPGHPRERTAALCATIRAEHPDTRMVVLDDVADADLLLTCIEAGADGYVSLEDDLATLVETVRRVEDGEVVVPPLLLGGLLRQLIHRRRAAQEAEERLTVLTPREREVLRLLADGHDHAAIAAELVVSEHTARTHIQNLLRKLDVHSRVEAVALAVASGWLRT